MARCLIIACGCRGSELARGLRAAGHAVRATTRDPQRADALQAEGVEALVADPDRVATLAPALDHVAVAYILLGSATGSPEAVAALHSTRLDMLLSKMLDSTVRGIVYEAAGTVAPEVLDAGAERVRAFAEDSRIPHVLLTVPPEPWDVWREEALAAVDRVLAGR
jgi:nucleoside-diphosphate-sugar epimerase